MDQEEFDYFGDGYDYTQHLREIKGDSIQPFEEYTGDDEDINEVLQALEDDEYEDEFEDEFISQLEKDTTKPEFKLFQLDEFIKKPLKNKHLPQFDLNSMGSALSMSSSAMFRNNGLTLLDDRFDKVMEEYESDEIGELEEIEGVHSVDNYDNLFDDFLNNNSIIGKRVVETSQLGKLDDMDILRNQIGKLSFKDVKKYEMVEVTSQEQEDYQLDLDFSREMEEEEFDCQSVLSTYSNLDNHPAIISTISLRHTLSERKNRKMKKTVSILPTLEESESETSHDNMMNEPNENYNPETVKGTIKRPKNETPEERKLRKMELKERKKNRRADKKLNRIAFSQA